MPRGDRTGPNGKGPLTGRGMGPCVTNDSTSAVPRGTGLGAGRGLGLGRGAGAGQGAGLGRGAGRGIGRRGRRT